eukprot:TRINITY_DN8356_c0_g1_i1.p1 TRINITY_DN8356_c0_g1~~TRINITY_DN8356_c0_g1_i1.p1  ORF type:complete len:386 (-),score=48.52 TRINITY_DN8356_c0_g1_i1:153-1310(-)
MCFTRPKTRGAQITISATRSTKATQQISNSSSTDQTSSIQASKNSRTSTSSSLSSIREILPQNPNIYSFAELARATNNFRSGRIGNSSVWKCNLRNKTVAVTEKVTVIDTDFAFASKLKELCSLHHRNVIGILGGCMEGAKVYLVYQFFEGLSLKDCLRGSKVRGFTVLGSWFSRVQIALDVAQGLDYLHHHSGLVCYVHKHLKSSSVMIVEPELRATIGQFGACELAREKLENQKITGAAGYMAPESTHYGAISQKSDVFSFGVLMLELLTGKEPISYHFDETGNGYRRVSIVDDVVTILSQKDCRFGLRCWTDPRLNDSFPAANVEKFAVLASLCVNDDPGSRPDMTDVAAELSTIYLEAREWAESLDANASRTGITVAFEGR